MLPTMNRILSLDRFDSFVGSNGKTMGRAWQERRRYEAELGDVGGHELVVCEEVKVEVVELMKCLKRGKAAGPDRIMNEMLMYGGGHLMEVMLLVMNVVMKRECFLLDWKRSLLVVLHKDGDVEQVGNYRGIALGCNVVKLLVRVLARRLKRFAKDRILTEVQGGFKSGRRCSDQWLVLRGVCQIWKREKKNSYLAFRDICKTYDSVWREELWHKMRRY